MRANTSVRHWERTNKQTYDTATEGSSALNAALFRNISAELAHWLGKFCGTALNDYEKFFDTLDVETLLKEAIHTEFPAAELSLALLQHMAPRIIQVAGYSSAPMCICKNILQGCKNLANLCHRYTYKEA